jgi:hypothetical protein
MSRLNAVIEAVEEGASGFIRLAYLLAGVLAVASYFGNGSVPVEVTHVADAVLPWLLAGALEVHTYLTARRVRAAWQGIQGTSNGSEERHRAVGNIRVNLGILTGLLAFSMLNQLQFLGQTWQPPVGEYSLPVWLAYVVRAVVVPLAFMAAAFLVPVGESLAARIKTESHHYAGEVFKVARQQWRQQLRKMQAENRDVTGALVQLIEDESERHAIEVVHKAMFDAQALPGIASDTRSLPAVTARPTTTQLSLPPAAVPNKGGEKKPRQKPEPMIRLVDPDKPARRGRTPRERVYNVLSRSPEASIAEIAKRAKCAPSTAVKHRKTWLAEHEMEPIAV